MARPLQRAKGSKELRGQVFHCACWLFEVLGDVWEKLSMEGESEIKLRGQVFHCACWLFEVLGDVWEKLSMEGESEIRAKGSGLSLCMLVV